MRTRYIIKIAVVLVGIAALGSLLLVYRWHLGAASALAIAAAVLFAVLTISVVIAWSWWGEVKAKSIVQKWAKEHGYEVLQFESPAYTDGHGFVASSRGQAVYSVTVRDGTGGKRKAWVRCGSYIEGVFSDEIEVKWQDEARVTEQGH